MPKFILLRSEGAEVAENCIASIAALLGLPPDHPGAPRLMVGPQEGFRCIRRRSEAPLFAFGPLPHELALSGLSFRSRQLREGWVLEAWPEDARVLLTWDGTPVMVARGESIYLCDPPQRNIRERLTGGADPADWYPDLLPAAVALRLLGGDACRHNPFPTACVIVDDPPVQPRYGFFDYADVLAELARHRYALTVAFIPWNFRRSDAAVARAIRAQSAEISICVHGSDHTQSEFADPDGDRLAAIAHEGLRRMEAHERLTGLPFDRVMVFPQGAFSRAAPRALKRTGYLAAVNSELLPLDAGADAPAAADAFDLAVQCYGAFPIFTRRYPREVFDLAVDLFFGKPVLLVEHHEYFRAGARALSAFVARIAPLSRRLRWATLEEALARAGQYRRLPDGGYEVRFAARKFRLQNPAGGSARFRCRMKEDEPDRIAAVTLDGREVAWRREEGDVALDAELPAGGSALIAVTYASAPIGPRPRSVRYRLRVLARRRLSDFRDNVLSRNEAVLAGAKRLKQALFSGKRG